MKFILKTAALILNSRNGLQREEESGILGNSWRKSAGKRSKAFFCLEGSRAGGVGHSQLTAGPEFYEIADEVIF